MENSTYYNTRSINFIKVLHRILVAFLVIVVVLIFALRLNDTVSFKAKDRTPIESIQDYFKELNKTFDDAKALLKASERKGKPA